MNISKTAISRFSNVIFALLSLGVICVASAGAAEQGANADKEDAANKSFLNSKPANPALPFSDIVRAGNTLFMSGQIGFDSSTGALAVGGFEAEAHQTMKNIKATLERYGYDMSQVVKCTVMLTDISDFAQFNTIYTQYFKPPYPARSAFAVKALALNSLLEVECIAHL
ncbi:RidA family protein [Alteromonas gracilis]|uniref:RidA family protein n=1 Tax=Alteromonas gracilis TaxID=1479524 RepID=UPI003734E6FC